MWMNEENGLRGGVEYTRVAKEKGDVRGLKVVVGTGCVRVWL